MGANEIARYCDAFVWLHLGAASFLPTPRRPQQTSRCFTSHKCRFQFIKSELGSFA